MVALQSSAASCSRGSVWRRFRYHREPACADRLEFDTFVLIYLSNADTGFEMELTLDKGRTEPYSLGDGYGHLALSVDDLDSEHQRLTDLGLNPRKLVDFNHIGGEKLARFFFISDPDGYKIEVLQRRRELFLGQSYISTHWNAPLFRPMATFALQHCAQAGDRTHLSEARDERGRVRLHMPGQSRGSRRPRLPEHEARRIWREFRDDIR